MGRAGLRVGAWGTSEEPDAAVFIRRDDSEARMDRGSREWTSDWPVLAPDRSWPKRERKGVRADSVSESV